MAEALLDLSSLLSFCDGCVALKGCCWLAAAILEPFGEAKAEQLCSWHFCCKIMLRFLEDNYTQLAKDQELAWLKINLCRNICRRRQRPCRRGVEGGQARSRELEAQKPEGVTEAASATKVSADMFLMAKRDTMSSSATMAMMEVGPAARPTVGEKRAVGEIGSVARLPMLLARSSVLWPDASGKNTTKPADVTTG